MNEAESAKILSMLAAAFPHSYSRLTEDDTATEIMLWTQMFEDCPYKLVEAAVLTCIKSSKSEFAPSVSTVSSQIENLRQIITQCAYGYLLEEYCGDAARKFPPAVRAYINHCAARMYEKSTGRQFTSQAQKQLAYQASLTDGK